MAYADEVLADSPKGYWKLDESAFDLADSSGNGLTITSGSSSGTYTIAGGATPPQTGTSNSYNDGDTAVVMTTVTARPYTLECWFYPTANSGGCIIQRGDQGAINGMGVGIGGSSHDFGSDGLEVIVLISNVAWRPTGYSLPSLNAWYHIVVVDNSTDMRVYVNGTLQATLATTAPVTPGNEMHIGRINAGGYYIVGSIAHVAVYDSALSAGRVTAHYDARSAAATPKSDTDSFTATDTGVLSYRTNLVATDLFRATELSFLNYTPTAPLNISFSGHRVYAQLADADDLPATPSPSRTFRMPTTTEDLDLYLLDENLTIIDPTGFTMTFDVGTPGVRVEGVDGDITAEPSGDGDPLVWITVPGGLLPGTYSCRLTVNTGTVESPIYRSYPTEPITLIVEE